MRQIRSLTDVPFPSRSIHADKPTPDSIQWAAADVLSICVAVLFIVAGALALPLAILLLLVAH